MAGLLLGVVGLSLYAQTFRERVNVELVRLDLLATDSQGRPVTGLLPADVQVKVDGRLVKIESFESPSVDLAAAQSKPGLPEIPVRQMMPASSVAGAPRASGPRTHYYMAFLVDETSSEQSNRKVALSQMFQFLGTELPTDVEIILMRFQGVLRVECPWTSDAQRLRAGVAALSERRAMPLLGQLGQMGDNALRSTTSQASGGGTSRIDFDTMEAVGHVRTSLAALFDALRIFPETPGRKTLFFVTDGAPFLAPSEIARDLIKSSASSVSRLDGPDAPRRAELEADRDSDLLLDSLSWDRTRNKSILTDIARMALVRGVEVVPVSAAAHDLDGRVRTDRSFSERADADSGRPLSRRSQRSSDTPPTTDMAAGGSMEEVATITGGEAVLSRRVLDDRLRREVRDRNAGYLLSFRDPFAGDHMFHKIEVSSSRSGLTLRYRRGYRILDVREELAQKATNRLHLPADDNPLGVRLQFDSLGQEKGMAIAQITVAYPATPEAGGRAGEPGAIRIIGICSVRDGALSDPIDLSGKAERTDFGETTWLTRSGQVRLKPGAYRWSFAIRDELTGITSYLTFDRKLP